MSQMNTKESFIWYHWPLLPCKKMLQNSAYVPTVVKGFPVSVLYLDVTEVMSGVTAESWVDQHSIQVVHLRFPLWLRHERSQVQVLEICDTLRSANKDSLYYLNKWHWLTHQHHSSNTSLAPSVSFLRWRQRSASVRGWARCRCGGLKTLLWLSPSDCT